MNDLDDNTRSKLEPALLEWLEQGSDSIPKDRHGRARIIARFGAAVWDGAVRRLYDLGLEVEGGELVADGAATEEDLVALARDEAVTSIGLVREAKPPPHPSTEHYTED